MPHENEVGPSNVNEDYNAPGEYDEIDDHDQPEEDKDKDEGRGGFK